MCEYKRLLLSHVVNVRVKENKDHESYAARGTFQRSAGNQRNVSPS